LEQQGLFAGLFLFFATRAFGFAAMWLKFN